MPAAPQFYSHPGCELRTCTPPPRYLAGAFGVVGGNGIMAAWANESDGRPVGDWLDRSTVASSSIVEVTGWLIPAKKAGSFVTSKLPKPSLPDPRKLRADPNVLGMNGGGLSSASRRSHDVLAERRVLTDGKNSLKRASLRFAANWENVIRMWITAVMI